MISKILRSIHKSKALGKATCQRNQNLTASDTRIWTTSQGTVIPLKTV